MPVVEVEKAIRHARAVIKQHSEDNLLHEAATRYYIIDPILRSLGWKLEDPKQCKVEEWRTLTNRQQVIDYILLNKDGNHVVLIEAKGFAKTKLYGESEETQLKDYASQSSAKIAVLTNGKDWYIYNTACKDAFGQVRDPDVDICDKEMDVATIARRLHRVLNSHKLRNSD